MGKEPASYLTCIVRLFLLSVPIRGYVFRAQSTDWRDECCAQASVHTCCKQRQASKFYYLPGLLRVDEHVTNDLVRVLVR